MRSDTSAAVRLPWQSRLWLVLIGGVLLLLLGTAVWLEPHPSGMGTHQQLGLPPCSVRVLWGIRCPACGMTTAWSHTVRGQFRSALQANAGGCLLALAAGLVGPWSLLSGLRGQFCGRPADRLVVLACLSVMLWILLEWTGRLLIAAGK